MRNGVQLDRVRQIHELKQLGLTQAEIGITLGISQTRVSQLWRRRRQFERGVRRMSPLAAHDSPEWFYLWERFPA